MIRFLTLYVPALLFILVSFLVLLLPEPFVLAKNYVEGMGTYSYGVYVLVLSAAVIFAPLTVMPIIPIATSVFGPFVTGILSVIGWTAGATGAFFIARYLGRPILIKFVDIEKIDRFVDSFPKHSHFWFIILIRHIMPVDIVSYALGLTKSLGFATYFAATLIGVTYFSFAFAYMGEAFFEGNMFMLMEIGLMSLAIFTVGWYLLRRSKKQRKNNSAP